MRSRKLLAMLLAFVMLVSMVPVTIFAAETGSGADPDNLYLDKNAVLTDDGTYTINLEAYATSGSTTETITSGVPLDVVLVMDQSGSLVSDGEDRLTTLKESVNAFLEFLRENGEEYGVNHRVAICGFASHSKQNNSGLASEGFSYANDTRDNAWTNTGIFVNGEFRDYGTVEYTELTAASQISTSGRYVIKGKFGGETLPEYTMVQYSASNGVWYTPADGTIVARAGYYSGYGNLTANQVLLYKYYVYTVGASRNLLTNESYAAAWENIAAGENGQGSINPDVAEAVGHLSSNGATATFVGMKMARKMLENAPTDGAERKKVVIVFTDGEPGANGYTQGDADAALAESMRIKESGTQIYTIGVYSAAAASTVETFMNQLSSNYDSHSFTATPTTMDSAVYNVNPELSDDNYVGYSDGGEMYYYRGIDSQNYGIAPYFILVDGSYCPVCIRYDVSTAKYYASYITDDGEYSITAPNEAKYYRLTSHTASSDPNADYYKHAAVIDDLNSVFESISSDVTSFTSEVTLDATAILKDVLADGFALTNDTTVTVSVVPGSVSQANSAIPVDDLTGDKIDWGTAQTVLTMNYPAEQEKSGKVVVNGAADRTEMTLTAKVSGDTITVTGFNYAGAEDENKVNAQYICAGHPGSKLVVSITGVEAKTSVSTNAVVTTNKEASGIYEGAGSDVDEDGVTGEMQAAFQLPDTYISSKTYYLDQSSTIVIDPADFLMTDGAVGGDGTGYHAEPGTTIATTYGVATVQPDGKVSYTMTKDNWKYPDVFYLFGNTGNATVTGASANAGGNMWAKIVIVPPEDRRGSLFLDKDVLLTDDGTYIINLEAYATSGSTTETFTSGVPMDVVLVMDQSGSLVGSGEDRLTTLKESVNTFLESLRVNGEKYGVNHRVAICGFASHSKQDNSGLTMDGYSYANDTRDNAWTNTGIFVDGEFQDYGTATYTRITQVSQISADNVYTIKVRVTGEELPEYVTVRYSSNLDAWYISTNGEYVAKAGYDANYNYLTAAQVLFNNFEVYSVGDSSNLLTDESYAAAWENIAAGENGQGSINPDITEAVSHLSSNGATATFMGMKMARKMLENAPTDGTERKKVVIVFTDGEPGANGYTQGDADAALAEAMRIKEDGTKIYTIGIYSATSATTVETFMNQLSSNYDSHSFTTTPTTMDSAVIVVDPDLSSTGYVGYSDSGEMYYYRGIDSRIHGITPYFVLVDGKYCPVSLCYDAAEKVYYVSCITDDGEYSVPSPTEAKYYRLASHTASSDPNADYYKHASGIDDLASIFESISSDVTSFTSEVTLDATAILKDVLADGFVLTNDTTVTVSVVPGSVSQANSSIPVDDLTGDKIDWGTAQTVLTMNYPAEQEKSGKVVVNGAADQTEMTLTAKVSGDTITVTGFNYAGAEDENKVNAQYICAGHPGSKLVVTVTGVEATADAVTDMASPTNKDVSGVYEGENSDVDGDGETGEIQSLFPLPTTYLSSRVYVVDYAKTMSIDTTSLRMTKGAIGLNGEGYHYFAADAPVTAITEAHGKVAVEDGRITYQPTTLNWNGYDTFYVFGTTADESVVSANANRTGNLWAKVSVLPANNVYYEDTFVTSEEQGLVGIIYSGTWTEDVSGETGGQGENPESGESGENGGVHGWENTLADDTGYSDGSAHQSSALGSTATFTFTGTGVDVYSRTNSKTGMIIAMLYEGKSATDENGKNLVAKYTLLVDNLAASGDYYQIPTLSLCQIPLKVDGQTQKDENGNTIMTDMPHGTYTVKIIVSKATATQTGSERFDYYLDGIRVYNPIRNLESDSTVSGTYGDKELNANFMEIRDKLLDATSFTSGAEESEGPVFIDRITAEDGTHTDNTNTMEIGTYEVFGPKNEVYLSAGQMIAFAVNYQPGAHYYVGLKSLTGKTLGAIVNRADDQKVTVSVGHTTDLYYELVPVWQLDEEGNPTVGIITIGADNENAADTILALTKLKVTGPAEMTFRFARVRNADLLCCAQEMANSEAPDVDIPGEEESTEPTNPTEPEDPTEPSEPEVDIDNPDSGEDIRDVLREKLLEMIKKIYQRMREWLEP